MSTQTTPTTSVRIDQRPIDPRGQRFTAGITAVVFALLLVLGPESGFSGLLLTIQTLAFAAAAFLGLQAHPYGWLYRRFVRPRLGPPAAMEDPAPPRFAQAVGLVFALLATVGLLLNLGVLFYIACAMALGAAFLNAAFDFCLGCEMFLIYKRIAK